MEKKYWLINVPGHNGYSMLVHCEANTVEQAINIASDEELFDDADDAEIAFGEDVTDDENTIKAFDVIEINSKLDEEVTTERKFTKFNAFTADGNKEVTAPRKMTLSEALDYFNASAISGIE